MGPIAGPDECGKSRFPPGFDPPPPADLMLPLRNASILSPFLKAIQWLLTSSPSSYLHFYPSLYLSFNNVFQKAVPTQDMTNPVSLPSFYCMWDTETILTRHY